MFGGKYLADRINGCLCEDLERLKKFRLMDDDFMSRVFDQNIEATQLLLSIILERNDLKSCLASSFTNRQGNLHWFLSQTNDQP